ncbi:hypothetical protein E3N85_03855 [Cryobacterium sp. Hz9]|nr:hypothetical protein E3N85_03855 [Cryobacterium sp. Hz9]
MRRRAAWAAPWPDQHGSAPSGGFADARHLRGWVAASGTRLERDRPTRQTAWPGAPPVDTVDELVPRRVYLSAPPRLH